MMDNREARERFLHDLGIFTKFKPGELIAKWRSAQCYNQKGVESYSEIVYAIIDAMTQEGQIAWNGDGTSIVAQYVVEQMARAERAEQRLSEIKEALRKIV